MVADTLTKALDNKLFGVIGAMVNMHITSSNKIIE